MRLTLALASPNLTNMAPTQVSPAPRRYTAAEPPSGTRTQFFLGSHLPDLAKAAEDRQQTTTNAGNHFPLLLFLPTNTPKVILMNRERGEKRGTSVNSH
jgi:hypothetical protein